MAVTCPKCHYDNSETQKFCEDYGPELSSSPEVLFTKTITPEAPLKVLSRGKFFAGKYAILGEIGRGGMALYTRPRISDSSGWSP
jgi:hypothetical protein